MLKSHVGMHTLAVIGVKKSVRPKEMNLWSRAEDARDHLRGLLVGKDLRVEPFYVTWVSYCTEKMSSTVQWFSVSDLPFSSGGTCDRFPPALAPFSATLLFKGLRTPDGQYNCVWC